MHCYRCGSSLTGLLCTNRFCVMGARSPHQDSYRNEPVVDPNHMCSALVDPITYCGRRPVAGKGNEARCDQHYQVMVNEKLLAAINNLIERLDSESVTAARWATIAAAFEQATKTFDDFGKELLRFFKALQSDRTKKKASGK